MSLETNTKGSQRVNKPFGVWNINNKAKELAKYSSRIQLYSATLPTV
jgi:hypothetical protein